MHAPTRCPHPVRATVQGIQNRFGLLFFILLFQSLMALSSLPIWQEDMLLFVRERDARAYTTPAYFAARVLFDVVPLRVFPPLAFALITYPAVGLHADSALTVLSFTMTLVVANTVASLLCMCLGAALPTLTLSNMVRRPPCRPHARPLPPAPCSTPVAD